MAVSAKETPRSAFLLRLGAELRDSRCQDVDLSVAELARRSGLSSRFLHDVENGKANISIERLALLARELGVSLSWLIQRAEAVPDKRVIALVGLRGAGKSTLGPALARQLHAEFFEVDRLVEQEAGKPLAAVFEDHGEAYFHELEARVLDRFAASTKPAVLAASGSIVEHPANWRLLRGLAHTVWLKASPKEHWDRVHQQGDLRPMRGRPAALAELTALWERRRRLYQRADLTLETSRRTVERLARSVAEWLDERQNHPQRNQE